MRSIFLAIGLLALSSSAFARTGYYCGTTDHYEKFVSKSTNLKLAKAIALTNCREEGRNPAACFDPYCVAYEISDTKPFRTVAAPKKRPARQVARAPQKRGMSGEEAAMDAIATFQRQQREQQIDEMIKEWQERHNR